MAQQALHPPIPEKALWRTNQDINCIPPIKSDVICWVMWSEWICKALRDPKRKCIKELSSAATTFVIRSMTFVDTGILSSMSSQNNSNITTIETALINCAWIGSWDFSADLFEDCKHYGEDLISILCGGTRDPGRRVDLP